MDISAVAAKNAPILTPLVTGAGAVLQGSDTLVTVGAVVVGLVFGAMWRTGSFLTDGKTWKEIRADLLISVLIGGANALLALALAEWFGLSLLFTMALGAVIGATGLRALPELRDAILVALKRRLLGDNVALIEPKDDAMRDQVDQMRHD